MEMGWLAWIIVGAIAGWGARMVMKSSNEGLFVDIIVGIAGAFIAGFLFTQLNIAGITGFSLWSIFVAFIGAIILLAGMRALNGRRVFPR